MSILGVFSTITVELVKKWKFRSDAPRRRSMPDDNDDIIEEQGTGTVLRSPIEILKEESRHLRGTIKETLESDASHFSEDEYNLLKFHGVYQQDDRDKRVIARKEGRDKEWIMMVRAKIPGGALSGDQY